ncbi:phosphatidylinositol phosphatase PTPRQ-like isoform X3 [Atheta coriaria]
MNKFNDDLDFTRFANTTGVDIPIKDLCGIHTVNILASNICGNEVNQTISIVIPAKSFEISMEKIKSNKAQIKITTNCHSNFSSLQISCDSGYNKTFTNVQDTDAKTLAGLEAFTSYSCQGELFKDNNSVGNTSFTFQTQQSVSNITDSSFEINWESPKNVRGILTNYTITLEDRPLYDSPVFYQDLYKNIKIVFQNLPGNYEFNITIKAITSKFGPLESITNKTSTPSPGKVENLNKFIDASKINQPKAQISWSYPCATYTSGDRVVFSIHIAENSKTTKRINETMNIDKPQQNFTLDLELKPSTNYTIMVYTINLDTSQISTANSLQFESPKGVTSPPLLLSSEIDSFKIDLYWEKPTYIFGNLVSYYVNITSLGPLHKLGCDEQDNTLLLETNSTHISPTVKPNHKYFLEVTTITSRMVGKTLKYEFGTKPFQSEPVLNLICSATEISSNGSAGLSIQFEPPCDTNGVFDYYSITVFDEQGSKVLEHQDNSTFFEISDMKYESTYRVDVNVVTKGDWKSRDEFCDVKTKSDKPNPPNLNKSEVIAHIYDKQVEVMLRDDYFDNSHGEVKFFALLVGLATKWETKNNLDSGYWDGIKWPNDEFWNEEGLPYQATPAKWQPLKGTIQKFFFKLGTQNCTGKNNEFCNGPLKPNTEYVLAIRGYTTNGYQISNKLRFVTQDLEKTQNVVMIISIVAGVLLIIIISSLACVYWKRRPNKRINLKEANQIVHNQENEFIPPGSVKIEELDEEYESLQNIPYSKPSLYHTLPFLPPPSQK